MLENESILSFSLSFLSCKGESKEFIVNESKFQKKVSKFNYDKDQNFEILGKGLSNSVENVNTVENETKDSPQSTTKVFRCLFDNCNKSFEYKWILERHANSHFSFKLFKCEYGECDKAYKSKENLILHFKNKHLGEKPYHCRFCTLRFSHRNGKTYHERKVHINYLPHQCHLEKCEMSFASKSALNYHLTNQHN